MILPTVKSEPISINPKFVILFGKPKTGKTTCAAALDDSLIIDLEGGSCFLSALAVQARNIEDIKEIASALSQKKMELGKFPYKYIIIDNSSRLEDITLSYALSIYQNTPMGKKYTGDVRQLPNGGGYYYIREAVKRVIDTFRGLCDTLILIGHTKDTMINVDGKELSEMSLDLAGKLSSIMCGLADTIGYVYREKNQTKVDFRSGLNARLGARPDHLKEQCIVLAESDEDLKIKVFWDKIFLPEKTE